MDRRQDEINREIEEIARNARMQVSAEIALERHVDYDAAERLAGWIERDDFRGDFDDLGRTE